MHKDFYASGFLYHPRSQQILLQKEKQTDPNSNWSLLGGISLKNESDKETFRRIINILFNLELDLKAIYSVYNYFHREIKKEHYISYAVIRSKDNLSSKKVEFKWFSFKETLKLKLSPQTKQDIIVMNRVIDSSTRKKLGLRTIG